ncbi:hypothetical protein [Streptomyces nigrescens]
MAGPQKYRLAPLPSCLSPEAKRLAETLRLLREGLGSSLGSLREITEKITEDCHGKHISKSSVSRFFSGQKMPPTWFLSWLHDKSRHGGGGSGPGAVTLENLFAMRHRAKNPTSCKGCNERIHQLSRLEADLFTARNQKLGADLRLAEYRDTLVRLKSEAGGHERSADSGPTAHLPVPPPRRDRQGKKNIPDSSLNLADRLAELTSGQQHDNVRQLLHDAPTVLTPVESATAVALLRGREVHGPAQDLIQVYSQGRSSDEALRFVKGLLDRNLVADARAALHLATNPPAGGP